MTCGIVLAGGASSRMGRPKALLALGSVTMAERLAGLFSVFCQRVVVVTGAHHVEIARALPQLELVYNERHAEGMLTSLQCGLRHVDRADHVLFSPVDFAAISESSVAGLFAAGNADVIKPRYRGQSGHPVRIGGPAIEALLDAPVSSNAKQVLSTFEAIYIDVEDPWVASDCDTPEQYAALTLQFGAGQ